MKKKMIIGSCVFIGIVGLFNCLSNNDEQDNNLNYNIESNISEKSVLEEKRICDGYNVTSDCIYDGIEYSKYIYHEEVPEKTHVETKTTYTNEIVGYCTMCNDGTRSPSCSTGRGTCSHHGGVRQWNAPIYREVAHNEEITVVDSEKIEAYWEKVEK